MTSRASRHRGRWPRAGRGPRLGALVRWLVAATVVTTVSCRSEVPADGPPRPGASAPAPPAQPPSAAATTPPSAAATAAAPAPSPLRQAIDLAAGYLTRSCHLNGRFNYRINLDPEITPRPAYNILVSLEFRIDRQDS